MQENKTRYFVYIWISLWKIVLFFSLFVAFESSLKVRRPEDELGYLCNVVPSMTVDGSDS